MPEEEEGTSSVVGAHVVVECLADVFVGDLVDVPGRDDPVPVRGWAADALPIQGRDHAADAGESRGLVGRREDLAFDGFEIVRVPALGSESDRGIQVEAVGPGLRCRDVGHGLARATLVELRRLEVCFETVVRRRVGSAEPHRRAGVAARRRGGLTGRFGRASDHADRERKEQGFSEHRGR